MRNTWSLFKREVGAFFSLPIAYILLTVYVYLTGFFFYVGLKRFAQMSNLAQNPAYAQQMAQLNIAEHLLRPMVANICVVIMLIIPMLTMRLFAEEKKSGTIELLLTSPVSYLQIVMSKFFAAFFVYFIMVAFSCLSFGVMYAYGSLEWGPLITSVIGLLLVGMTFISVGTFTSTLTDNQVVAAVLAFGALLLFWVIGWNAFDNSGALSGFLQYLSIPEHFENFAKGVVDTRDLFYFVSFTFVGLFLTKISLESTKWRL